ncbi:hypothetical protein [Glycomyces tenuis]|uniref:hypothetical protein n=1 Tax=Glycomyces tenuis TaxID=58116 RepID=UPI00040EBED6|nr:hypothetical protein [Glycomyces tenuis]
MLPYEVADNGDGTYTVTNQAGTQVVVDEEALRDLTGSLGTIQTDLESIRDLVTNGNLTRIRSMTFHLMPDFQFEQVDALNLKLGGFDDAVELRDAYRENFYKGKADQVERINHGYATGEQVSQDIMQNYLDEDGNVQADVNLVESQFTNSDGITESEVDNADEIPPESEEPGSDPQH